MNGTPIAYSLKGAAAAIGHESTWEIKQAIAKGDLTPRYRNSKPMILHSDLKEWAETAPVDKPEPRRRKPQ